MPKVRYVGAFDEVEVPMPDGRTELVKFRGHLETSKEHADALLAQPDNWHEVTPPPAKEPDKAEPKADDKKKEG